MDAPTSTGHLVPLRRRLTRALVPPLLACLLVLGYVVTLRDPGLDAGTDELETPQTASAPSPWRASYSRRFPGCVAAVLWLEREIPVAVVVRAASGRVERVPPVEAARRALSRDENDDVEIIGACYRR